MNHQFCPACGSQTYQQGFNRVWQFCWCGWRISNLHLQPPYVRFTYGAVSGGDFEAEKHSTRLTAEAVDSGSNDSAPVDGDGERS